MDHQPTQEGIRRWPPDGYLRLSGDADRRERVACTCTEACGECHGGCGCEACALGWLVYQDEQALWDEDGELVNVAELGAAWKRVVDPRQLRLRYQFEDARRPRGDDHVGEAPYHPPSPSVPPMYDDSPVE